MGYEKEIAGFDVAVDYICGVHEQESSQDLVHEVLDVLVAEILSGVDHPMQVGLHQLSNNVDIDVAGPGLRLEQVHHIDYILMFEEFCIKAMGTQHLDFPDNPFRIDQIIERIDHLPLQG